MRRNGIREAVVSASGRKYRRRTSLLAALTAMGGLVLVVAGWGSTTTSSATTSSLRKTPTSGVAVAKARALAAEAIPSFKFRPTLPVAKVKALAGKTIWFVSEGQSIPYFAAVYQGIQAGASALGMNARVYDANGSVTAYNQGVRTAIAQHAAGIVLGFPPGELQPSIGASAKAAGIPITDAGVVDLKNPLTPGDVGHVAWSYSKAGAQQADWVIAHSNGNASVFAVLSTGYAVQDYRLAGFTSEMKALCPKDCAVLGSQHVPFTEWTTQLPTIVTTFLTKHPSVNYVLVAADAMVLYVQEGIQRLPNSHVIVVSSDASSYNLGLVHAGKVELADEGEPEIWIGWAADDVIVRWLTTGAGGNEAVPLRLFTQTALPANYNNAAADFPVNLRADFKKEWGLG